LGNVIVLLIDYILSVGSDQTLYIACLKINGIQSSVMRKYQALCANIKRFIQVNTSVNAILNIPIIFGLALLNT